MSVRLTDTQINDYCLKFLEPVTGRIEKSYGPHATEYVGSCLLQALRLYDPECKTSVSTWVYSKTPLLVIEAMRSFNGRKGTARYTANASRTSLDGSDGAIEIATDDRTAESLDQAENLNRTLRLISKGNMLQKCILLGRVLGNFTNTDMKELLLDVSQAQIHQEIAEFRQLVPSY